MQVSKFLCVALVLSVIFASANMGNSAMAWERGQGRAGAAPSGTASAGGALTQTVNMDLSSTDRSISASALGLTTPVTINVGGAARSVNANDVLTPAELMAASQVMNGGMQTLKLGADGNAVRGRFSVSSAMASQLSDLVIPQNVKLVQDFGTSAALSFSGDLVNSGRIFAYSSNAAQTSASFSAQNIVNETSGVIIGCGGDRAAYDLDFRAAVDFVNRGRIESPGSVTITAGGSVRNEGQSAVIQSMADMNIWSSNVMNSGTIASGHGNVNFNTVTATDININNLGGQILAQYGAVNLRDANYLGAANANLTGGNVLSQSLNLYAGNGVINVNVEELTGTVNSFGYGAHVMASTGNLQLGNFDLVDPTFYNDAGNISINGTVSAEEAIAIIASGDIVAGPNGKIVAKDATDGKNITLIAGAAITPCDGCSASGDLPDAAHALQPGQTISVDVTAGNGGVIDFSASTQEISIDASAPSESGNGGKVTLVALGEGPSKGNIVMPVNGAIHSSGGASGSDGCVKVFAEGSSIILGTINAGNDAGSIMPMVGEVNTDNGLPLQFNSDGSVVGDHTVTCTPGTLGLGGTITLGSGTGPISGGSGSTTGGGSITITGSGSYEAPTGGANSVFIAQNYEASGTGTISITGAISQSSSGAEVNISDFSANATTLSGSAGSLVFTSGGTLTSTAGSHTMTAGVLLIGGGNISLAAHIGGAGGGRAKNQPQEFNAGTKIDSINLSNPAAVEGIVRMQDSNAVGGTLVTKGGVAVGGNLVIEPSDLASSVKEIVIPAGVTVEFNGFTSSNSFDVSLGSSSSSKTVVINGTANFNGSSDARVNIHSYEGAPVLIVGRSGSISSNGNLTIGANGNIKINGDISNTNINGLVKVETNGAKGDISLSGEMGSATTNLSFSLYGNGRFSQGNGLVTASSLTITGTMGSIGSLGSPIKTAAENISATTTANGMVNINNTGSATLDNSMSGDSFTFVNNGNLMLGDVTAGRALKVVVTSGSLTVADGAKVRAYNGNLTLQNMSLSNPSIVVGASAELSANAAKAGMGNVNVFVGAGVTRPVAGSLPTNVQVVGNTIYFGSVGITALPPDNVLTAASQNIVFNTRGAGANAITLNGGVQVSATKVSYASNASLASEDVIDTGEFAEETVEETVKYEQAMAE